ncbi:MAG: ATP-binding protein [Firmicutes bacterium]|nr:ATP-binding protein [Bacillota bacterium]
MLKGEFKVPIRPDSSILAKYASFPYKLEAAFSEFIDNSTQSYISNSKVLKEKLSQDKCTIKIEIYQDKIVIEDNSFGMNVSDFKRALKLDSPPEDTSGRNEQGMGLKTAATWLGRVWTVDTTEFGSDDRYFAEINVDNVKINKPEEINAQIFSANADDHFTIVTIKELNQRITVNKVEKLSKKLSEIFFKDLSNKLLVLIINKQLVKYELPKFRKNTETGNEYLDFFEGSVYFENQEYKYEGWAGIREKASVGDSGFTLLHKGRAIITNYRPYALVGKPNSFPYQRIIGEIQFSNNLEPSHTKDTFQWEGLLEEELLSSISTKIHSLKSIATKLRKDVDGEELVTKKVVENTKKSFQTLKDINVDFSNGKTENSNDTNSLDSSNFGDDVIIPISFNGMEYKFIVVASPFSINKDWLTIETTDELNKFLIKVDSSISFFSKYKTTYKDSEFVNKLICALTLSVLEAKVNGVKDSIKVIKLLNTILGNIE